MYITRLASNEIFSPSNKIHREVGWAKDLSAPRYITLCFICDYVYAPGAPGKLTTANGKAKHFSL